MDIILEEIDESSYFEEYAFKSTSDANRKERNQLIIGNKCKPKNYLISTTWNEDLLKQPIIEIIIHQQKHDNFQKNSSILLNLLIFLHKKDYSNTVKIKIITNHYDYYIKEFHSLIFSDTSVHNKYKFYSSKLIIFNLIRKYFGYKSSHLMTTFYNRAKRLLRH
ncbi:hypothetical protein [Photorhabdus bodei]|uniref:Uncharacterized protein n=1 Tax=Photorhabdus bodei TaxID=2029681 RepID=A0A329XBM1_9GAMM|nr:hypothetical protein [Photorhabdus bodei]RAX12738.1 hypothetical protein CKY02_10305 [Photorhabdus bodei]